MINILNKFPKVILFFSIQFLFTLSSFSQDISISTENKCITIYNINKDKTTETFKVAVNIKDFGNKENLFKLLNHSNCNVFNLRFNESTSEIIVTLFKDRVEETNRNTVSWWNDYLVTRCLKY